jgi:hypothetical protein
VAGRQVAFPAVTGTWTGIQGKGRAWRRTVSGRPGWRADGPAAMT